MDSTQNQNTQPDYGFIVNQQTEPPKKMDTRIKVIIGLLIILVLLVPIFFILGRTNKTGLLNTTNKHVSLTEAYLDEVDAQNYEAAYQYFDPGIGGSQETYTKIFAPLFRAGNNIAECVVSPVEDNTNATQVQCTDRNNTTSTTYQFSFSSETSKITSVDTTRQEPIQNAAS